VAIEINFTAEMKKWQCSSVLQCRWWCEEAQK